MSRLGIAFFMVASVACDPATLKHTPDAAKQIDGAPDAPNHGVVTVTVYDPNNPSMLVANAPVVFIEADGTVAGEPKTDSLGIAHADVHDGAVVTAIVPPATPTSSTVMMTLAGVKPGDNITLGPSKAQSFALDGTFTVSFNAYMGATSYIVVGPCGESGAGSATSVAINIDMNCKQPVMDIIVVALTNNTPVAYLEKPNVPYMAGGSTFVSGTYLLPGTFNASYTNVDPSITNLAFYRYSPVNGYSSVASGAPANGSLSLSGLAFNAQTSRVETRATRGSNQNWIQQNMPGNALTYSMDATMTLLPWVGPATIDVANKKLMVTVDTTGTSHDKPDLFFSFFSYSRTNGSAGTSSYVWYVMAPEPGDITLPALPSDVSDVLPQGSDTVGTTGVVSADSSTTTWDTVRLAPFDFATFFGTASDTSTQYRRSLYQIRGG